MAIVAIGDSMTYCYGLRRDKAWPQQLSHLSGKRIINKGVNGDSSFGLLARFMRDVIDEKPSRVIIMIGYNDIFDDLNLTNTISNIRTLTCYCKQNRVKPLLLKLIYLENSFENKACNYAIKRLNEKMDEVFKSSEVEVIDVNEAFKEEAASFIDGIHLTERASYLLAEYLNTKI